MISTITGLRVGVCAFEYPKATIKRNKMTSRFSMVNDL
jgi:hypothetical protein